MFACCTEIVNNAIFSYELEITHSLTPSSQSDFMNDQVPFLLNTINCSCLINHVSLVKSTLQFATLQLVIRMEIFFNGGEIEMLARLASVTRFHGVGDRWETYLASVNIAAILA